MFVIVSYDVATSEGNGQRRLRRVAKACQEKESCFLIRARDHAKRKVIQVFADGSTLVEMIPRDKKIPWKNKPPF